MERLKMIRGLAVALLATLLLTPSTTEARQKFIVKMKSGHSINPFTRLIVRRQNARNLAMEMQSKGDGVQEMKNLGLVILDVDSADVEDVQEELANHPLVEYAEPEVTWELAHTLSDNRPSNNSDSPYMEDILGLDDFNPDPYITASGNRVTVAVVDTGATYSHLFLSGAIAVNSAELNGSPGVDDDGNGYIDDIYGANVLNNSGAVDEVGTDHGSHVSGLVKAVRDQAIEMGYSAARGVQILPIRFINSSGQGTTSGAIKALEYAASRGAKVVNASWGAQGSSSFSQALFETMADLYEAQDILIVAAAGNYAINNDSNPFFPANFSNYIPGVMSVGSVTPFCGSTCNVGEYSDFSNYGANTVDIATVGALSNGSGINIGGLYSVDAGTSNTFVRKEGTSMSTPLAAGVAAVVRAINPNLTAYEVKRLIMDTATPHVALVNRTKEDSHINASLAFSSATTANSQGLQPAVNNPSFGSSSSSSSPTVGGCGSIVPPVGGSGNNPFGGNSMLLLLSCYFLFAFSRKLRKQSALSRN